MIHIIKLNWLKFDDRPHTSWKNIFWYEFYSHNWNDNLNNHNWNENLYWSIFELYNEHYHSILLLHMLSSLCFRLVRTIHFNAQTTCELIAFKVHYFHNVNKPSKNIITAFVCWMNWNPLIFTIANSLVITR